jgi:hypothetical protein
MTTNETNLETEPAAIIGWVTGILTLILNAVVIAVPMDANLTATLVSLITFVAPVVAGYLIRQKVFAPDTVKYIAAASPASERRLDRVGGDLAK